METPEVQPSSELQRQRGVNPPLVVFLLALCALVGSVIFAVKQSQNPRQRPADLAAAFMADLVTGEVPANSSPSSGNSSFAEVASELGVDFVHDTGAEGRFYLPEEMGPGAALFDFDGDGWLDLFLAAGGSPTGKGRRQISRFYHNRGGRFQDVTEQTGIQLAGQAFGTACADFDEDGDVDLFVTRLGANALLVNEGNGRFVDRAAQAGVDDPGFGTSCTFFDYDRDGDLDLYVTNYVDWSESLEVPCYSIQGVRDYCNPVVYKKPSVDLLYRNRGDGTFENVTKTAGIASETGNGLAVVASDLNGDGLLDLYVANDQTPAFLWQNKGDGSFENTALWSGTAFDGDGVAIAGMGIGCEDFNGDGFMDLLVTNIRDQSHLYLENDKGMFNDRSAALGLDRWSGPATTFGIALFDQDHDGRLDGYFANGDVNLTVGAQGENPYGQSDHFVRFQEGLLVDHTATSGSHRALVGRGVTCGDFDNDGDLDLVVTNNGGPVQVFRNLGGDGGNWLMLALRMGPSKRHAIGARVLLQTGETVQIREVRPQQGYLASNDPRVHFGLAKAQSVDRLQVIWPDGRQSEFTDLPVNQHLEIVRGTGDEVQVERETH